MISESYHRRKFAQAAEARIEAYRLALETAEKRAKEGIIPRPKYAADAIQSHINNSAAFSRAEAAYHQERRALATYDALLSKLETLPAKARRERRFAQIDLKVLCRDHGLPPPSPDYERVAALREAGEL